MPTSVSSSGLSRLLDVVLPADRGGSWPARFGPSHPADIPRTPPFAAVRQSVDNSLTCRDSPLQSARVRHKHVRNVVVGACVNAAALGREDSVRTCGFRGSTWITWERSIGPFRATHVPPPDSYHGSPGLPDGALARPSAPATDAGPSLPWLSQAVSEGD